MYKILDEKVEKVKIINDGVHKLPFVISIPHSGLYLTKKMTEQLKDDLILANMDWYLPELYSFLEKLGFTVIINNVSRYVIDVNRDVNGMSFSSYAKALIYMNTTFNKEMYDKMLSWDEIKDRINNFYFFYHENLKRIISEKLEHFAKIYIIDLHSFGKQIEAEVVLGNNNGKTMNEELIQYIRQLFANNGFKVAINDPFRGGYITKNYGNTKGRSESIQIELAYWSYIERRNFEEEYLPCVNKEVMEDCQKRLRKVFYNFTKM